VCHVDSGSSPEMFIDQIRRVGAKTFSSGLLPELIAALLRYGPGDLIAPSLNQHVEDLALVVDGTPQIHPLAGDPHHHLVEVPAIARSWTAPA
jgi:hypothetical protein